MTDTVRQSQVMSLTARAVLRSSGPPAPVKITAGAVPRPANAGERLTPG